MAYVLALDEGTTSARALVVARDGSIVATAQREIRQIFPQPGWVEHDAHEIASAQIAVAVQALERARIAPDAIAAIGITNQRETTFLWDRATGEPIHHAIVWQDRRTAAMCERLVRDGCEPMIAERTGLVVDPYFSATKIAWLLDHVPGARVRAEAGKLAFGTVDSWLLHRLTAGRCHATDPSNAARTLLFNLRTGSWDDELLRLFRIPASVLPEVRTSSEVYAETDAALGLGHTPIAGIAGDQQASLFGHLATEPGQTKTTYGTGCFLLQNTGSAPIASRHRLLSTVAWRIGARTTYALEGSVFTGGAVVTWLRDGLHLVARSEDVDLLAASVPDSGGVHLVPAFVGLGAPHWDQSARGLIIGLTPGTTAAHIARAALDGIAFQVADLVEAIEADSGVVLDRLDVDGGGARSDLTMQIQADLLGRRVVRPAVTETTALGAAYLAGLAVGFWRSTDELRGQRRIEREFAPSISSERVAARRARWRDAVARARGWEPGGAS